MAGYKITSNNAKKNSILKVEGICPICQHYPSKYKEVIGQDRKGSQTRQFKYCCPICNSTWDGNIYTYDLMLYTEPRRIFKNPFKKKRKVLPNTSFLGKDLYVY